MYSGLKTFVLFAIGVWAASFCSAHINREIPGPCPTDLRRQNICPENKTVPCPRQSACCDSNGQPVSHHGNHHHGRGDSRDSDSSHDDEDNRCRPCPAFCSITKCLFQCCEGYTYIHGMCVNLTTPPPIRCVNGHIYDAGTVNQRCVCHPGFTGQACDQPEPTTPAPIRCVFGRSVNPGTVFQHCECNAGFMGPACDQRVPTTPAPIRCVNGEIASPWTVSQLCVCYQGFMGPACDQPIPTTPAPIRCVNGWIANPGTVSQQCVCNPGLIGAACDQPKPTTPAPIRCVNGWIANPGTVSQQCVCNPEFTGTACDQLKPTTPAPIRCVNGWIANPGTVSQQCVCNPGFTGTACDQLVQEHTTPEPIPCVYGEIANPGTNSQHCVCYLGFIGKACDQPEPTTPTTPTPIRCVYGEITNPGTNSQHCVCYLGFIGKACDQPPVPIRCVNGTVINTRTAFRYCECHPGFAGTACDTRDISLMCPSTIIEIPVAPGGRTVTLGPENTGSSAYDYLQNPIQLTFTPSMLVHCGCSDKQPVKVKVFHPGQSDLYCEFGVIVTDIEPPKVYGCPEDIFVRKGDAVAFGDPVFEDNVGILDVRKSKPFSSDRVEPHLVVFQAVDFNGNSAECSFVVNIVEDPDSYQEVQMQKVHTKESKRNAALIGAVVGGVLFLAGILLLLWCCRKRQFCKKFQEQKAKKKLQNGFDNHIYAVTLEPKRKQQYDNKLYVHLTSDRRFMTTASSKFPHHVTPHDLVARPPPYTPSASDSRRGSMKDVEYMLHPSGVLNPTYQALPSVHGRKMSDQVSVVYTKSDRTYASIKSK